MHHNVLARVAAPLVGAALIATGLVTPAAGDDLVALPQAAADSTSRTSAEALLDRALAVKDGARAKAASAAAPVDVTMLLRELKVAMPALSPADRAVAQRLFARPTDSGGDTYLDYGATSEQTPVCGTHVCVHYVASSVNAATADDVQQTLDVMEHVWGVYAKAGYKSPKGDGTKGGSGKFDVYLGQLADDSLYGYCTVDSEVARKTLPAYCVLDNDFADVIFNAHTPLQNLQVTAAHEFFHAIQFNYDYLEDPWFMEVSSTWAEDELYDSVNDNVQYLAGGQIGLPNWPLDLFEYGGTYHYGNWIWLRYLTEKFPTKAGGLPVIVRTMWRKAGDKMYSIQAISSVLKSQKTSFAKEYALFAAKNRFARKFYAEGKAEHYPSASHTAVGTLPENSYTDWLSRKLRHQSSASFKVSPSSVSGAWRLKVSVNGPAASHGPMAVVDRVTKKGKHTLTLMRLDKSGDGWLKVPFASATTQQVVVTLVNAGTSYKKCSRKNPTTWFACGGKPQDDRTYGIKFQVVKN